MPSNIHNLRKGPRGHDRSGVQKQSAAGREYSQDVELRKNYIEGYSDPCQDAVHKVYHLPILELWNSIQELFDSDASSPTILFLDRTN